MSIENAEEDAFLADTFAKLSAVEAMYWTGLAGSGGNLVWSKDGRAWNSKDSPFENWQRDQPAASVQGNRSCCLVQVGSNTSSWAIAASCEMRLSYVCEREGMCDYNQFI